MKKFTRKPPSVPTSMNAEPQLGVTAWPTRKQVFVDWVNWVGLSGGRW